MTSCQDWRVGHHKQFVKRIANEAKYNIIRETKYVYLFALLEFQIHVVQALLDLKLLK